MRIFREALQIQGSVGEEFCAVLEFSEAKIARRAEKSSDPIGCVTVIEVEALESFVILVLSISADGAFVFLSLGDGPIFFDGNSVVSQALGESLFWIRLRPLLDLSNGRSPLFWITCVFASSLGVVTILLFAGSAGEFCRILFVVFPHVSLSVSAVGCVPLG